MACFNGNTCANSCRSARQQGHGLKRKYIVAQILARVGYRWNLGFRLKQPNPQRRVLARPSRFTRSILGEQRRLVRARSVRMLGGIDQRFKWQKIVAFLGSDSRH